MAAELVVLKFTVVPCGAESAQFIRCGEPSNSILSRLSDARGLARFYNITPRKGGPPRVHASCLQHWYNRGGLSFRLLHHHVGAVSRARAVPQFDRTPDALVSDHT